MVNRPSGVTSVNVRVCVLGFLVAVAVGCASDDRPGYVAPSAAKSDVAILKGAYKVTIGEVDGDPVDFHFNLANNNEVAVTPGTHKLLVYVGTLGGSPSSQSGLSLNVNLGPDPENRFAFVCERAHTYEFSRRSVFNGKLMVTDKNTGQSMDIDSQDDQ